MIRVIDIKKQEIGGGFGPDLSAITSISQDIPAGQTTITIPELINATIILLSREIVPYTQGDVPAERVFTFDTATGLLTFNFANPSDAEVLYILYYPTPSTGVEIADEPVSLGEAKTHLRVTFPDDDVEIYQMIRAARQAVEDYCNISIVMKRITAIIAFEEDWDLPWGPVVSLDSVETGSGKAGYGSVFGEYVMEGDLFTPAACQQYRLVYTVGYQPCPYALKASILNQVSFLYENRGKTADSGVCDQARQLANPYRKVEWI